MLKLQFRGEPEKFVKLSVSTVTAGRDEGNDLVIDSPAVSDFHAEITTDKQSPWIIDLLSKTGTFVNEHRITGRCELKAWDVIRLGAIELEVVDPNSRRPEDWALRTESDLLASQFFTLLPETIVGRDPACDLTIDSSLLSRRHAKLIIEDKHLNVIDLGSANGTFINGEKITEANALPGDELRLDQQKFIVIGPNLPATEEEESMENQTQVRGYSTDTAMATDADDTVSLGVVNDDGDTVLMSDEETRFFSPVPRFAVLTELSAHAESSQFRLEKDLCRIGRSDDCEFVLADKSVSKQHAEFSFSHGDWIVKDLGSSNGVMLNGERTDEATLQSGDRLKMGRREFEFLIESEITPDSEVATRIYQGAAPGSQTARLALKSPTQWRPTKQHWIVGGLIVGTSVLLVLALLLAGQP